MPGWKHPAQSFRGHGIPQKRHQAVPCRLRSIRGYATLQGALSSLQEQDETSTGNPCTAWDSHFTTETAAKKKVPVSGGDPVCHVLTQPGKRFFFPVEIIYTGFLCDGPWEQCSSHIITAALFSRSPLPKLGDLPSQGEDDRALHQACNFPGCKNFNSPFHLPMSAWGFSPSGGLSLKSSASKPQGKKRWLGPLWFSSQCTYPKLFF